ncbi:MAG: hypothetical protein E7523_04350 [Ruminococcaceae bacterium]|nr:hypothetical protein [Oscillospiraceae bacterium]
MKKLFSFLFTAILVITMMPQAIGASADSRIYWQDTTVTVEDSFSIVIEAENLEKAKSLLIIFNYDTDVLELTGCEWLQDEPFIFDFRANEVVLTYEKEHSFNGQLLRVDFIAKDVPKSISPTVDFDINCVIKNGNAELAFTTDSGEVNVLHTHEPGTWHYEDEQSHIASCGLCLQPMSQAHSFVENGYDADKRANVLTCHACRTYKYYVLHGDIDRNGRIESSDARSILRFAVELDVPDETQRILADVNADGKISAEDARLTLRTSVDLEDKTKLPVMQVAAS